jgi:hypothetical protein
MFGVLEYRNLLHPFRYKTTISPAVFMTETWSGRIKIEGVWEKVMEENIWT